MATKTNDSFLQWDPAQVGAYIDLLELESKVGSLFLENNIEGSLLPFMTTEHLKELGIDKLGARLGIKRAISQLIAAHYETNPPKSFNDPEYRLTGVNINSNYINIESLVFSTVMLRDLVKKGAQYSVQHSPMVDPSPEIKRLNDNFTRLKSDLIPVIRLLKDSKPLPTPTLDPGHNSSTNVDSPTLSLMSNQSSNSVNNNTLIESLQDAGLLSSSSPGSNRNSLPSPSPTASRFSSGTLLSLGTGKVVGPSADKQDRNYRPRLVESSSSSTTINTLLHQKNFRKHPMSTLTSSSNLSSSAASNEPLKQLRASSEDSCLKILQQAMKRHHIPRDDWSRYVLVICYGDKERILKLTEKPVIIFKELQELGKHPAIMLRQLAETSSVQDNASDELYEDSRIGDDIPGGTL